MDFPDAPASKEVVIPENVIMDGYCFTEKDVTLLKVYANSEAERYAQTMGFKYEVIGSHTHNWEEASVANEATCKNEGRAIYRCTICGTTKFEVISKKAHEPESEEVHKKLPVQKLDIQVTRFAKTAMKYLRQERAFR
ncbi:MAG: hypothetical protein ACLTZM_00745 [Ruminococcus sp.]